MMIQRVGVIGAGTMGTGVSIDLILHGIQTVLVDIDLNILKRAETEIIRGVRLAPLVHKTAPKVEEEAARKLLALSTDLKDLAHCEFIIENVPEIWEIKAEIYHQLDQICKPEVCFGANTSCTSITKIGSVTNRPDKIVGMHFMNPSYMKDHIEVIRGFHTSDAALEIALKFLEQLEKKSVVVNDFPGFVANRVSHLMMNEAAFLVQDQVASAEQVDTIFKKCYGHKMGPLETADLIGLDTVVHSLNVLYESYQDPKFRVCPLLKKMVDAGLLGRKSGKGFYSYKR